MKTTSFEILGFNFVRNEFRTIDGTDHTNFKILPSNVITKILFAGFTLGIPVSVLMLAGYGLVKLVGFIFG